MMEFKGTPGPWIQAGVFISGQEEVHVCTLNYGDWRVANSNARAIAAVPKLIEALQALLNAHECIIEDGERFTPEGNLGREALRLALEAPDE